jgi:beta-glucosidase
VTHPLSFLPIWLWVCQGLEPLYPFGHGLSYTTFKYDNLKVRHLSTDPRHDNRAFLCGRGSLSPLPFPCSYADLSYTHATALPPSLIVSAQAAKSADGGVSVSVDVSNSGDRAGADVPQLYVTFPEAANEPPVQLKGFHKVRSKSLWTRFVEAVAKWRDLWN